jgi:hypothetical protein
LNGLYGFEEDALAGEVAETAVDLEGDGG